MVHIPLVPAQACIPAKPAKPLPQPAGTRTLVGGYRFVWVRVRVALEYPRVTLDNPYSVSLYSGSDSVVLGSESGSQNVPCRGTVVSGAQNVPCLDRAVVRLTLLTQGQQGRVSFCLWRGLPRDVRVSLVTSAVIQWFIVLGS